ncbi:DNA primase TraC [Afipia felis]|uniref:DNA primase TraC n=2 Tax=Afipia felis TaxID=1035 RepID=A0A380W407_AFIFE|nr:protein of unknown function DUF1738 [Afipia sp. 1NLS2]EKS30412.1 hypothetical protein HMPREF9697_02940 [Afipia felis ATCC 53690]SUU75157.1 DNA primase TraC [Afipia felis]SUU83223.1 DNA primase TraC [Afipia felis]
MSSKTASARPGHDRASLYDEITGKIIAELEAGRVPWVQPWGTAAAKAPLAMPKNAATGRQYSGINVLILWGAVIEHGFPAQSWLTFRQALSLGGNVRKGEHGTTVVYADRFVPDDEKRRARETGEEAAAIPFLKRFTVFNAAQCENLPAEVAAVAPPPPPGLIEPRVEALIRATGVDLRIGGNRAFYAPGPDYVMVPPPQAYFEPINWHRTALHELGARQRPSLPSRPRSRRRVRQQEVCVRGAGGGDERRLLLCFARHRSNRPARRLHWLLARSAAGGQPRCRPRRLPGQQSRRLASRLLARR